MSRANDNKNFLSSEDAVALRLRERLVRFPWGLMLLLTLAACIGFIVLLSAVGKHNVNMLISQVIRFSFTLILMVVLAMANEKVYRRYAYLVYGLILLMLTAVAVMGDIGMGARRWLEIGFVRLQPSEMMKAAIVLALARYFHDQSVAKLRLRDILIPLGIILAPLVLIVHQPDLGTAVLLAVISGAVIFVAGLSWNAILAIFIIIPASTPLFWNLLHDYQKRRILTLFFPEGDPLGAGYHIIQSKIAVGSGGLTGKGFMGGSQSHLDFLPERHTDFIFSVLAEEWGFMGAMTLIVIYGLITLRGLTIAAMARDRFGLLLASGLLSLFLFQVVINIGMVIGLLPVVGIPLPLVSYGGSSMMTIMLAMGLLAHVSIHSKQHGRAV
ncbi:MAG: rod shape-determining protein RodA [Magnetococcales bacterium]|nr:rod shape-determining protein RodA [Magnetococcales bacterium]MBF0322508.1 rod shape-determining protein RodA [Magnetococcales bacterium]